MNTNPFVAGIYDVLDRITEGFLEALPEVLGALLLLGLGVILARVLRAMLERVLTGLGRRRLRTRTLRRLPPVRLDPAVIRLISGIVYWIILLLFLTAATETLGFPVVTSWLSGLATYLPRILTAVLVGVAGVVGANLLRETITRGAAAMGLGYAETLGRLARVLVLLLSLMIAVDLVGLNLSLLVNLIYLVVGALLFGAALAFGLGSRTLVANILAAHYVQKTYEVGQVVRIDAMEGRIVRITPTALVLQTADEQVLVPAERFNETNSSLLSSER